MAEVCLLSRDGTKVLMRRKTPSDGWTRMVIVLLGRGSLRVEKIAALVEGLKWILISVRDSWRAGGGVLMLAVQAGESWKVLDMVFGYLCQL